MKRNNCKTYFYNDCMVSEDLIIEKVQKPLSVPHCMYLKNIVTNSYIFVIIDKSYLIKTFKYITNITEQHIVNKFSKNNYHVLISTPNRKMIIDNLKARFINECTSDEEKVSIKNIFDTYPEFLI